MNRLMVAGLDWAEVMVRRLATGADGQEGIGAFVEKRRAKFVGNKRGMHGHGENFYRMPKRVVTVVWTSIG
jgi:hypothetical protein